MKIDALLRRKISRRNPRNVTVPIIGHMSLRGRTGDDVAKFPKWNGFQLVTAINFSSAATSLSAAFSNWPNRSSVTAVSS